MASYNKVVLMGNLTRDPELRYTPSGTPLALLGMAMNYKYRGKDEQLKEEVTFVDVSMFGKIAEAATKYLQKGAPVLVDGRLSWHQWQTPTGEKRSKLNVVATNMQLLPRGGGHSVAAGEPRAGGAPALDMDDDADPFGELPDPLGLGRRGDA